MLSVSQRRGEKKNLWAKSPATPLNRQEALTLPRSLDTNPLTNPPRAPWQAEWCVFLPNEKLTRLLLIALSLMCTTHIFTRVLWVFCLFFIHSKGLCFWKEQDMNSLKLLPCDQWCVCSIFHGSCDSNIGMMSHSNRPTGGKPIPADSDTVEDSLHVET